MHNACNPELAAHTVGGYSWSVIAWSSCLTSSALLALGAMWKNALQSSVASRTPRHHKFSCSAWLPVGNASMRPATEDWTAFFHITPSANNAELVGQLDHAITDHEYPPTVWAAGEVVQVHVQISAAKLQPGSYAVLMGMYAPVTQMRAAVEAGPGVVVDNRALLLEFQPAP